MLWRGAHTGPYGAVAAAGKLVQVRDFAVWRFAGGTVAEISTIQDQITLLKQIGYLPEDGCAARSRSAAAVAPAQEVRQARTGTSHVSSSGPPGTNTAASFARAEGILRVRLSETEADARASRSNCVM